MTSEEIMELAKSCGHWSGQTIEMNDVGILRFAELVAAKERQKHQADIEKWKTEAATAEKWRGMALSKDPAGVGTIVQAIQKEAAAYEREAYAQVCDKLKNGTIAAQSGDINDLVNVMLRQVAELGHAECAAAIRARSQQ